LTYAPLASAEFQRFFAGQMSEAGEATAKALGDNLAALWLGGGFGRGEGAVTHRTGEERAHNDVDTFLFVHDAAKVDAAALKRIEHLFSERLGAEFEYSHPIEISSLSRLRPALMWFDVLNGHEVLAGKTDVARLFPPELSKSIPVFEGPRLLLNRGAGLVWALRIHRGLEPAPDGDFVRRNLWKARLGLLEAALMVKERYVFGLEAKKAAFVAIAAEFHDPLFARDAVERAFRFKLAPDKEGYTEGEIVTLAREWEAAFREVEARRFGREFASPDAYGAFGAPREPGSLKDKVRNLARNAKAGRVGAEHPREPLYRELPRLLTSSGDDWAGESERFLAQWRRFC